MEREPNEIVSSAKQLFEAGQLQEAERLCQEALKAAPQDGAASHLLGCIAFRKGDLASAAQLIEKAVGIDPDNTVYAFDLGNARLNMGQFDIAEKLLRGVTDREPDNQAALVLLGHALAKQDRPADAAEQWMRVMSLKLKGAMENSREPLYHPFNTDSFDLPDYDGERLNYLVCSSPRCGSTLLDDVLVRSGDFGVPHEYLNFPNMGVALAKRFGIDDRDPYCFRSYFEALRRRRTSPNGVFGIKAHFSQFVTLIEPPLLQFIFPNPRFIQIIRRNRVAQAVSYSIALQSQRWNSTQEAKKEPRYNPNHIDQCLTNILSEEAKWQKFFQVHALEPLVVYYEDLVADSAAVGQEVADFLGVPGDHDFDIAGADFQKVGDQRNADWEARYRAVMSVI